MIGTLPRSITRAGSIPVCALLIGMASKVNAQVVEPPPIEAGRVPPHGVYQPGFDALHYDVSLTIGATSPVIQGRTRIDVAMREPRRDDLWFDFSGLAVTRASIAVGGGAARTTTSRADDGRIHLAVPATARVGDTLHVEIVYEGTPDDGLILRDNVHGQRSAFADNWPDRARFWFPAIDHPSDKATASFEVRVPAGWEVISNGLRADHLPGGTPPRDGVWRWSEAVPVPTYTMVIGAADFAIGNVNPCAQGGRNALHADGCVPISYWVFPADSAKGASIFRRADRMVEYYSQRFGPFPYEKLAHIQSATRFGGMENVGAIFYSEQAIAQGRLDEGTVAHETTHQWFGDGVTEADWSHLWLSEGFATYFGIQFFEQADGKESFQRRLAESRQGYFESDVTDLAMVDTSAVPDNNLFSLLNANSYNKGGQVLHMLRGLLGDDAFFAGIRLYFQRYENRTALTRDLQHALEEAAGKDLGWFFDEWAYRPGYPIFRLSQRWDAAASQEIVTVEQVQKATWPAFRMPVEFEFATPSGPVRRKAEVSGRRIELRFELPTAPTAVRLDPDGWVLHRMETG
jgi:aminopeptidase N